MIWDEFEKTNKHVAIDEKVIILSGRESWVKYDILWFLVPDSVFNECFDRDLRSENIINHHNKLLSHYFCSMHYE